MSVGTRYKCMIPFLILLVLTTSCATKLTTSRIVREGTNEEKVKSIPGLPIPVPELVKIVTRTNFSLAPGADSQYQELCNSPLTTESYDYLASSEVYYLNFDPSHFADSSLSVNFNDKGLASVISLNSDAGAGLEAVTGLVNSILPFYQAPKIEELELQQRVGVGEDAAAQAVTAQNIPADQLKALNCQVSSKTIKVEPM